MINVTNKLMAAWFELLNGNLSVPVFRTDAPREQNGDYVIIRMESDTDTPNNHKFFNNPVLITEVVTKHRIMIDDSRAADIDSEIASLLFPAEVPNHALSAQDDIQIISVQRRDAQYLPEDDGTDRYHRLITRNVHKIGQLTNQS